MLMLRHGGFASSHNSVLKPRYGSAFALFDHGARGKGLRKQVGTSVALVKLVANLYRKVCRGNAPAGCLRTHMLSSASVPIYSRHKAEWCSRTAVSIELYRSNQQLEYYIYISRVWHQPFIENVNPSVSIGFQNS